MLKKIFFLILISALSCNASIAQTRTPYLAGSWYPAGKNDLKNMLNEFFAEVDLHGSENKIVPFGLISPHAGLPYSGSVAAYGYSLLTNGNYDTVILLGSSHKYNIGKISIYNGDYYKTPLGKTPINKNIVNKILKKNKDFVFEDLVHQNENSLEMQIPFLQYQLNEFSLVPILTVSNDFSLLDELSETLIEILENSDQNILIIASTDMSHYHDYDSAVKMDNHTIELILNEQWQSLKDDVVFQNSELCGYYAVYTFLEIMKHFNLDKPVLLNYKNSGDVLGNPNSSRVVGYCSLAFPEEQNGPTSELNSADKEYLLNLARRSIEHYPDNQTLLEVERPKSKILNAKRAVFVTLNKNSNLRGCIGQMKAQMPLYEAVLKMAISAAFNDYRFSPVTKKEMNNINIEISVLTPMQKIDNIDEIKMGRDGVWIQKGKRSGVYLPQVATETGWDKKTFLENLCSHKAHLPKNAYKNENVDIYIFQVEKFSETRNKE